MLYADLGIKDIRITGTKDEPIISALHTLDSGEGTSKGFWLPLGLESVGTQRFFSRIGMWLAALESGAVLVVDEIGSSMHPLLTAAGQERSWLNIRSQLIPISIIYISVKTKLTASSL